jgi:hypothetical protein
MKYSANHFSQKSTLRERIKINSGQAHAQSGIILQTFAVIFWQLMI